MLLDQIVDHRKSTDAVQKGKAFIKHGSNCHCIKTTKGWEFLCAWKDESQDWIPLKDLKECYPIEVSEYAKAHGLIGEPAFAWWGPQVFKTCKAIINKVKSRYWKQTHKYGIELPKTVEEALAIDAREGNHFWRDAIKKEMKTMRVAYKPYKHPTEGQVVPEQIRQN